MSDSQDSDWMLTLKGFRRHQNNFVLYFCAHGQGPRWREKGPPYLAWKADKPDECKRVTEELTAIDPDRLQTGDMVEKLYEAYKLMRPYAEDHSHLTL